MFTKNIQKPEPVFGSSQQPAATYAGGPTLVLPVLYRAQEYNKEYSKQTSQHQPGTFRIKAFIVRDVTQVSRFNKNQKYDFQIMNGGQMTCPKIIGPKTKDNRPQDKMPPRYHAPWKSYPKTSCQKMKTPKDNLPRETTFPRDIRPHIHQTT